MTNYCLGFAFYQNKVLLIGKLRPEWQRGKLNGVGGKIEITDKAYKHAMIREFREETGRTTFESDWKFVGTLMYGYGNLEVFKISFEVEWLPFDEHDEKCAWYDIDRLPDNVIPNLRWLIPLCLEECFPFTLRF